jgi:hypothetical protein
MFETPSSFDKLRMRAIERTVEILILSLWKDQDFGRSRPCIPAATRLSFHHPATTRRNGAVR